MYILGYIQPMNTIYTTDVFDRWFSGLRDQQAAKRIQARIDRAEDGNLGDVQPIGEGVSEMRIHYGPGYRVYLAKRGQEIIVLLAGGDKSTQASDIKHALELARQL
jgi:putative addiction module killer protein